MPAQRKRFRMTEGSLQQRFFMSRDKIQIYGGGFGNGKTSGAVIKALKIAEDYPGSSGLIARSTYPRLNDTIRKEFIKWCPTEWIASFPMSQNSTNTCRLKNGSEVNFRYVQQKGKQKEQNSSNLLSATYDWIVVDQVEDPEIEYKDFIDLLGRLRGSTVYAGNDPTMPASGPRWMILTCNPTRNWVYKKLIKPYHKYLEDNQYHKDLLCSTDENGVVLLDEDGSPQDVIMGVFEGSTYENQDHLPPDFIKTLEATYHGQMRDRFLLGLWKAFEGLVYPSYEDEAHCIRRADMLAYLTVLREYNYEIEWLESYDHGLAVESCYLLAFSDPFGNVFVVDGFYQKEKPVGESIDDIKAIRRRWSISDERRPVLADPQVFRRTGGDKKTVGNSTSDIFWDNGRGIQMERANNDIINGIIKVQGYLALDEKNSCPITGRSPAPHLFFATELGWIGDEIGDYYWQTDTEGERVDKPVDRRDHAMDSLKYLLTRQAPAAKIVRTPIPLTPHWMKWREIDKGSRKNSHRYGRRTAA